MVMAAIDEAIHGLDGVLTYRDDAIVFGATKAEHDKRLTNLLERFTQKNVPIRASKCMFSSPELEFMGFTVDEKGYHPDTSRFRPLTELESPRDKNQLRFIMGCLKYYSRFIPNFATKVQPLFASQSSADWKWMAECERILHETIQMITNRPVIASFSPTKRSTLITDALDVGIGALLQQDGCPIICISRLLNAAERGYSQAQKEALAVYWAFRPGQVTGLAADANLSPGSFTESVSFAYMCFEDPLRGDFWARRCQLGQLSGSGATSAADTV
ncbi:unnamed protein product [Echinostoma caproni]|uniref:Reverse transcriptase domain-containing protein n=1 Tax=Echinostoma caproni TaxID=27848 RepID=A0A183AV43_9TREM|nr:unnamed protein product [Echinostoma caproni]